MRTRPIRHPLYLALLSTTLLTTAALAQADSALSERLLACDALQNAQDRLACFNSIVDSIRSPAEPAPRQQTEPLAGVGAPARAEPAPPPEPVPDAPANSLPEPAPAVASTPSATPAPEHAEPDPQPQPAASRSTRPPAGTSPPAAPDAPVRDEPSSRPASLTGEGVIVRVWENYDGRFTVELDNGQVWRETQGTRVGIPDVGAKVEVTRSLFGAYRMKIDGIPQVAWIRQTD